MSECRVQQIDHVELFVPDRHEAARWYEQTLGLRIVPELEFWANDPGGPLMIAAGTTRLALFTGAPRSEGGFRRVAFLVDGAAFLEFCRRLGGVGKVIDQEKSWSIYFADPWGHRMEITTYDYDHVVQHR